MIHNDTLSRLPSTRPLTLPLIFLVLVVSIILRGRLLIIKSRLVIRNGHRVTDLPVTLGRATATVCFGLLLLLLSDRLDLAQELGEKVLGGNAHIHVGIGEILE
jgi:hypothetical protein